MRSILFDLIGKRFGSLTLIRPARPVRVSRGYRARWLCLCDCGKTTYVRDNNLISHNTTSCGCKHVTHRKSRTRTYKTWQSMWTRTANRNHIAFHHYGGRGIRVCKRWESFENFFADMGPRPPRRTIDRFPDMNGNYRPGNCRWATASQQRNNKRKRSEL